MKWRVWRWCTIDNLDKVFQSWGHDWVVVVVDGFQTVEVVVSFGKGHPCHLPPQLLVRMRDFLIVLVVDCR